MNRCSYCGKLDRHCMRRIDNRLSYHLWWSNKLDKWERQALVLVEPNFYIITMGSGAPWDTSLYGGWVDEIYEYSGAHLLYRSNEDYLAQYYNLQPLIQEIATFFTIPHDQNIIALAARLAVIVFEVNKSLLIWMSWGNDHFTRERMIEIVKIVYIRAKK